MKSSTVIVLRVLAATVVAVSVLPGLFVSGCNGKKVPAGDAGVAIAHVTGANTKPDAGVTPHDAIKDAVDEAPPTLDAADLTLRGRHLLEAIAHGEPKLAADIVYPRDAYMETRDHADPGKQWDKKAYPAFERDVLTLRKRLHLPEQVQFLSFELGPTPQQALPKRHELKRPVWRVRHCKLSFAVQGKTQRIEIAEMTAWRGAWYISKLR